jgi:hypothetical protein
MQKTTTLLLFLLFSRFCFSQVDTSGYIPTETKKYFSWGAKTTTVLLSQYGDRKDIVVLNVHADELTSVEAAKTILKQTGGLLIEVQNEERLIHFERNGIKFQFDPNRVFTSKGLERNLVFLNRRVTKSAIKKVKAFSTFILGQVPKSAALLVAVHNNINLKYSINSYKPNRNHAKDALKISVNRKKDPDNFFIVTRVKIFNVIRKAGFNVVLQNNGNAKDDGSLSIYYGRKKKPYVNVEAQHGSLEEQVKMLKCLFY